MNWWNKIKSRVDSWLGRPAAEKVKEFGGDDAGCCGTAVTSCCGTELEKGDGS